MAEPRRVLFVCTGNLCRSPMAAAIATARHEGGDVVFESAGVQAIVGAPATSTAVAACREIGVEASGHRSRQLDREMAEAADRIFVMTGSHRAAVLQIAPGLGERVVLLRPDGADIEDPFGSPIEVYRASRDEIAAAIEARKGELSG
ncbi:MAG: low molecular weight protein arginine phosphatase [Acidimicrobiia bacterium]|nr:low molecular weight protein arginine phosphatase [Acidimicrobiia bacterium]